MNDLPERLRELAKFHEETQDYEGPREALMREAADEIERLYADVAQLNAAISSASAAIDQLTRGAM